jgi:hypothetical protein
MNIDHKKLPLMEADKPEFNWFFIIVHFALANLLAWMAVSIPTFDETVRPFVNIVSAAIPSVAGMGRKSPNVQWGEMYFLFCLVGSPFYIRFFWKIAAHYLLTWVKEQQPFRFWLVTMTMLFIAVGSLFFLEPSKHSYNSIRSADLLDMLMKESYLGYGLIAMLLMMVFSFCLSVSIKAIHLRIVNQ